MSISLPATSIDTLAESSVADLASSTISNGSGVEPVILHQYRYSRKIRYYIDPFSVDAIRIFIRHDLHLRDHAQLNGFDIFFVDRVGQIMPFELVYYSNGTGEWWVRCAAYGTQGRVPEVVDTNNQNFNTLNGWIFETDTTTQRTYITVYMVYNDRTRQDFQPFTTDPTTKIWDGESVVAHSTYGIPDEYNRPAFPYEEPVASPESRPVNSVQYTGHSNGFTAINYTPANYTYLYNVERIGNACAIFDDSSGMSLQIPIYEYLHNIPSTGGDIHNLTFCITGRIYHNNGEDETLILRYRNVEVTAYVPPGDPHWSVNVYWYGLGYGGGEYTRMRQLVYGGIQIPLEGGVAFGFVFNDTTMENLGESLPATELGLAYAVIDTENSLAYTSQENILRLWNDSNISYTGAIHSYLSSTSYMLSLLEVRSDLERGIHHNQDTGEVTVTHKADLQNFGSMVFDIDHAMTIGNAVTLDGQAISRAFALMCGRTQIYQGLSGGCN